ncbi:flavin-containing monooxygenase [Glutamicibacter sp. AOP38-B1-38]|uniref:flavin-containing monooxygenase n=1 Tax=Glutamicibacter sp. AOP38-B1-38 TaxID=3457680 RepID=UPI0040346593
MGQVPSAPQINESEIDVEALRAKYAQERRRRLREDGAAQYRKAAGEFGYYAKDPYTPFAARAPLADRVEALVIGGGFGGLLTGANLRKAGVESIRMLDEAGDFGGTWYWNRYPGIHCDIESYVYMPLLEEVGYMPTRRYAPGEEIRQHAVAIAKKFDLYADTAFHTRVTSLTWDEECSEWIIETDRNDKMRAKFVITSSGTLTQPKLPGIEGIENFKGHTFHTSRWDYDYTAGDANGGLTGLGDKRVAVIGTGATGLQAIPHVAENAKHTFVFQRTPSTVDIRANRDTDPHWAASLEPGWQKKRQDNFLDIISGEDFDEDLIQDGWTTVPQLQRAMITGKIDESLSAEERERAEELLDFAKLNQIRSRVDEIVEDPQAAEKLKPWYRYMCKRPGFSDTYLQSFNRKNVTLVDTAEYGGVTRMTESTIVVGDTEYEVDCVIFATGFDVGVSGVLSGTMPVYGRGGLPLLHAWAQGPKTLHGFQSHRYPNLFHLGALQNANSVNFVHILQEQAEHLSAIIQAGRSAGVSIIEPSVEEQEEWTRTIHGSAIDNSKFQLECTPGYYNNEGKARPNLNSFGPGPVAFAKLLKQWRENELEAYIARHIEVNA